jgi:hypothetical protein
MRWQSAWLVACSVVLLAGCGGSSTKSKSPPAPRIPAAVAQQLAADADAVAALSGCAAYEATVKFRSDVIASVSRIPARYQEPLASAANDLSTRVRACPPPQPDVKPNPHGRKKGHKKHGHHEEGD